jgi:hypothetical protein
MSQAMTTSLALAGSTKLQRAAVRPTALRPLRLVTPSRPPVRAGAALGAGPAVGTATAGRLRLTRRGRIAVRLIGLVLGVLVTAVVVLAGGQVAKAGQDAHPIPVSYHVVAPGETLWQIAGRVAPDADRRDTVARIVELNALPSAALTAGQRIAVPNVP